MLQGRLHIPISLVQSYSTEFNSIILTMLRIVASKRCKLSVIAKPCVWRLASTIASEELKPEQKLRSDIKKLGSILGTSIRLDNEEVFKSVEELRALGREVSLDSFLPTVDLTDIVAVEKARWRCPCI